MLGESDSTLYAGTGTYESRGAQRYRAGSVLYDEPGPQGARRVLHLPTLADVADSAFVAAHCFSFGGEQSLDPKSKERVLRLDFRPAAAILTPDVEGSVFLDAERLVARRAFFRVTRTESLEGQVPQVTSTTTYRELLALLPVVEETRMETPLQRGTPGTRFVTYGMTITTDRISSYQFEANAPGGQRDSLSSLSSPP